MPVEVALPLFAALGFVPLLVELPLFSGIAASPALDAPPAWANAKEEESANAPAKTIVLSFMGLSSFECPTIKTAKQLYVPFRGMVRSIRLEYAQAKMK